MNAFYELVRARLLLSVTILFAAIAPAGAQFETLIQCPASTNFEDRTTRGFYVTNYPGQTMNSVTLYMNTSGPSAPYQVVLTATEGTFDGPVVASGITSVTLQGTEQAVAFQMAYFVQNQQIGNPPITPGATICFKIGLNSQPGAPIVFYNAVGTIGEDLPNLMDPCSNVVQTNDTAAPLSTFRREGVKLTIVGERPVFLDGDCLPDAYEMAVFGGLGVSNGTGDYDGDGDSDWDEWLGGTDPTDPSSKIGLELVRQPGGELHVCWNSVAGRVYNIQYANDLASYTQLFVGVSGIGGKDSRLVNSSGELGFYRLFVINPETISKN